MRKRKKLREQEGFKKQNKYAKICTDLIHRTRVSNTNTQDTLKLGAKPSCTNKAFAKIVFSVPGQFLV